MNNAPPPVTKTITSSICHCSGVIWPIITPWRDQQQINQYHGRTDAEPQRGSRLEIETIDHPLAENRRRSKSEGRYQRVPSRATEEIKVIKFQAGFPNARI